MSSKPFDYIFCLFDVKIQGTLVYINAAGNEIFQTDTLCFVLFHILQSRYDAQKARAKNGVQLNSILIIGVKAVDPQQHQYLNESLNSSYHGGFMASLPSRSTAGMSSSARSLLGPPSRPYHLQNGTTTTTTNDRERRAGAIASPTKSIVSKVMDLMFGI